MRMPRDAPRYPMGFICQECEKLEFEREAEV